MSDLDRGVTPENTVTLLDAITEAVGRHVYCCEGLAEQIRDLLTRDGIDDCECGHPESPTIVPSRHITAKPL